MTVKNALKILTACLAVSCCRAAEFTLQDEFNTFTRGRSTVALEDRSSEVQWEIVGPVRDISCGDGVLKLAGPAKTEVRLFSKRLFKFGSLNARIRLDTAGKSFNSYAGFARKEPWAAEVAWVQFNDSSLGYLLSGRDKTLPKNIWAVNSGELKPGVWYDLRIDWTPNKVELFIDGRSRGKITEAPAIPQTPLPLLFAIFSMEHPYSLSIDRVIATGGEAGAADAPPPVAQKTTPVPLPQMPRRLAEPPAMPSAIRLGSAGFELENRYFKAEFTTGDGLQLRTLTSKYLGKNLLPAPTPFFMVHEHDVLVPNADFKVASATETIPANGGREVRIVLDCARKSLQAVMTLALRDDSPELEVNFELLNRGGQEAIAGITAPLLRSLQIGDNAADDRFFYPVASGAAGGLDCELRQTYGVTAFLQVMSVFNPAAGGGVYAFTRETDGYPVIMMIKKKLPGKPLSARYDVIAFDFNRGQNPPEVFTDDPGTSMAWRHIEYNLKPGMRAVLPSAVVGVQRGDWKEPLRRYAEFARSWFKKRYATPRWYMDCYGFLSGHPYSGLHLLHGPGPAGFFDRSKMDYCYGDNLSSCECNALMEFAGIFDYDAKIDRMTLDEVYAEGLPVINAYSIGNYNYNRSRGGLALLRAEIEKIHAAHSRFVFYTFPTACARGTEFYDAGKQWAQMSERNRYASDYTGDGMGWNFCIYEKEFGETIGRRFARILQETGADGYRLDVMARLTSCYNPAHHHYDGTTRSSIAPADLGEVLLAFKRQAYEVNPESIVTVEHSGNDFVAQYHDGFFSENIIWMGDSGMWEPYRALNEYGLVFSRFIFPEVKTWIHGPADRGLALKMSLFNAVGVACSDASMVTAIHTLEEHGDAFNSGLMPEPYVDTLTDKVLANFFPGRDKNVWAVWNRSGKTTEAPFLAVPIRSDRHYVEVYADREVAATGAGEHARLALPLENETVAVIAELSRLLEVRRAGTFLEIAVKVDKPEDYRLQILYDRDDYQNNVNRLSIPGGKVELPLREKYDRVIVKLMRGGELADEAILEK